MPPRGSEAGLDFSPILTHYVFLGTTIAGIIAWLVAFIGQIITTSQIGRGAVGVLWFAIFLQLFFIVGVVYTLASDSIAMHRFQLATFGAVAIVFSAIGADAGIFSGAAGMQAMGAGWLILAMVNIIWTLYFTSEQDSLFLHLFNSGGNGGLTPPSRRRTRTPSNMHNMATTGNYATNYASGGGISSADIPYDAKQAGGPMGGQVAPPLRSQNSFQGSANDRSFNNGPSSLHNAQGAMGSPAQIGPDGSAHSPLMPTSPLGAPPSTSGGDSAVPGGPDSFMYKAKALYAYTASPDDPNEISFTKGEILDIVDKQGKWWQARKSDGAIGIAPSNYLQII